MKDILYFSFFLLAFTANDQVTIKTMFYNLLGQKIIQNKSENEKNIIIDVSFLESGLFYIKKNITNSKLLKFIETN